VPTENKTYTTYDHGWILRVRPSNHPKISRVLLLIHGWTGDENSMWVFTRQIPDDYLILAPRGPIKATSGYGWAALEDGKSPPVHAYTGIANQLIEQITRWSTAHKVHPDTPIHLMGFSQGAAMCYTILSLQPERTAKIAALSGFLPPLIGDLLPSDRLAGKEIFVAHGIKDDTIPFHMAEKAVEVLKQAGASVHFCQEAVGHKLGAACFKGLKEFFE